MPQIILDNLEQERAQSDEDIHEKVNDGPDLDDIFHIEQDGQVESHSIK